MLGVGEVKGITVGCGQDDDEDERSTTHDHDDDGNPTDELALLEGFSAGGDGGQLSGRRSHSPSLSTPGPR